MTDDAIKFSRKDADRLPAYGDGLGWIADLLRAFALKSPLQPGGGAASLVAAIGQGRTAARYAKARRGS